MAGPTVLSRVPLPPRAKTSVAQSPVLKEYTVAWIATLPVELASAMVMLDTVFETPQDFIRSGSDSNVYYYGSIRKHNVVIASLPADSHYTVAAATTAQLLLTAFPNIKFTLLVGIGGAIPKPDHDIRLGDVVIGGKGVFQHDHGKREQNDIWVSKSNLVKPPDILGKALNVLLALHEQAKTGYLQILQAAMDENQQWADMYKYPDGAQDRLFQSGFNHVGKPRDCSECDPNKEIHRPHRRSINPHLHNGVIASGNSVVKDSVIRDMIGAQNSDCICLEMEAGGLMGNSQFLVIRGICDYSDSHKNNAWQRYSAATAAVVAKELLKWVPPADGFKAQAFAQILAQEPSEAPEARVLKLLDGCDYENQKNEHREAELGTCSWFTNHKKSNRWWYSSDSYEFLWLTLGKSRGKSVLTRHLVDIVLSNPATLCYFFFKPGIGQRGSLIAAMQSILHQLFKQKPAVLKAMLRRPDFEQYLSENSGSFSKLWGIFLSVIEQNDVSRVVLLFDAFDNCRCEDRLTFLESVRNLHNVRTGDKTWVKIIVTSRLTENVRFALHVVEHKLTGRERDHSRHIPGDEETDSRLIQKEVEVVVKARVTTLRETQNLSAEDQRFLLEELDRLPKSTYLWVNRVLTALESYSNHFDRDRVETLVRGCFAEALEDIPFDDYSRTMDQSVFEEPTQQHSVWH